MADLKETAVSAIPLFDSCCFFSRLRAALPYVAACALLLGSAPETRADPRASVMSTSIAEVAPPGEAAAPRQQISIADFSVVEIRGVSMPDARSGRDGGRVRQGGGIVIDDKGLVLTTDYMVVETSRIDIIGSNGESVPASLVGYDPATGLGVVRAAVPLPVRPIDFADSADASVRDPVLIVGFDGVAPAYIVSRREYVGPWEYLLEDALFTAPGTTGWSGAALINREGKLLGVGSLLVSDAMGGNHAIVGNMFVPINVLKPILADLVAHGKRSGQARPWLGMRLVEMQGHLLVTRVSEGGPAARSGLVEGDIIVGAGGEPLEGLADFYRRVWSSGGAGTEVELEVLKGNAVHTVSVKSMERMQYLRAQPAY